MKTSPRTKDQWIALALFPFKAYVAMGLPFLALCRLCKSIIQPRFYGRPEEATLAVSTGYVLCLVVLLIGALLQAIVARRGRSIQTVSFFLLGIVFLWLLGPWGMIRR